MTPEDITLSEMRRWLVRVESEMKVGFETLNRRLDAFSYVSIPTFDEYKELQKERDMETRRIATQARAASFMILVCVVVGMVSIMMSLARIAA